MGEEHGAESEGMFCWFSLKHSLSSALFRSLSLSFSLFTTLESYLEPKDSRFKDAAKIK